MYTPEVVYYARLAHVATRVDDDATVDITTPNALLLISIQKHFMLDTEYSYSIFEVSTPTRLLTPRHPLRPPHAPSHSSGVSTPNSGPLLARNLKLATSEPERGCPLVWWSVDALII